MRRSEKDFINNWRCYAEDGTRVWFQIYTIFTRESLDISDRSTLTLLVTFSPLLCSISLFSHTHTHRAKAQAPFLSLSFFLSFFLPFAVCGHIRYRKACYWTLDICHTSESRVILERYICELQNGHLLFLSLVRCCVCLSMAFQTRFLFEKGKLKFVWGKLAPVGCILIF